MSTTADFAQNNILSNFYNNKGETKTEAYRKKTEKSSAIITEKFFSVPVGSKLAEEATRIEQEQKVRYSQYDTEAEAKRKARQERERAVKEYQDKQKAEKEEQRERERKAVKHELEVQKAQYAAF